MKVSYLLSTMLLALNITACSTDDSSGDSSSDSSTSTTTGNNIGLITNSSDAYNGYTLLFPIRSTTTYLIDNCGEKVASWDSDYTPQVAYLLPNGNLLHTGLLDTVNSEFENTGGLTGRVEIINPDGEVEWYYEVNDDTELMHHDVEWIEDTETVLIMVWEWHSADEAAEKGRSDGNAVWSEKIIEVDPDDDSIVWSWNSWDHLVNDNDSSTENFGVIANNPGKLDINYNSDESDYISDQIHMNGVDYNADLDQIVLSSRNFSEVYIIDHSTTTAEAATSSGGYQGQGGDILYRWGNPQAYGMGDQNDQVLFYQHDANWIPTDYEDGGQIIVYNNQAGYNEDIDYSAIEVIDTGVYDKDDSYTTLTDGTYSPASVTWHYEADEQTDLYSENISGTRRLPNGNTLITEGTTGTIYQVTYDGDVVWEYVNPVDENGEGTQGEDASKNFLFRSFILAPEFEGLSYYSLEQQGTIESGSDYTCEIYEN